jgi:hypothetical protein
MPSQPKTKQKAALVTRALSKEQLLDMVATGWTQQRIADHVANLTGQPISQYYICKTLQTFGDEYQAAKKAQAQYHAERIAEIADKVEDGRLDPASARISSENRKWVAARLDPSQYGDRIQADIAVTDVTALHLAAMRDALKTVTTQAQAIEQVDE